MTRYFLVVPGLVLLGLLGGCIPTQRQLAMEQDLAEMKRRLAEVERSATALRQDRTGNENRERLEALGRSQAELQAALDAARVELQSLTGRLEDLRREGGGARDETALLRDDLGLKIAALEDRAAGAEERLTKLEQAPPPAVAPPAPEPPEAGYERALELIRRGEFADGREQLQEFLRLQPQHPLAINAMYWIGESFYGEKKFENAILQFQDVIQKFPDHPKTAAAMLKQAMAFDVLGDRKNARVVMQKMVDTFPLSEEAKKGRERLAEWNKVGKRP